MPGREIPSDGAGKGEGAFQLTTCLVLAPKASGAGMLSVGTGQTVPPSRDSLPQALDPLWSQVPVTPHSPHGGLCHHEHPSLSGSPGISHPTAGLPPQRASAQPLDTQSVRAALSQGQKKEVRGDVRRWHGGTC